MEIIKEKIMVASNSNSVPVRDKKVAVYPVQ